MDLSVRELVKDRTLVSIAPDRTAREAAEQMTREGVGMLVVLEDDVAIGVLTDRDLTLRVAARPGAVPDEIAVRSILSSPVIALEGSEDLDTAIRLLQTHGIRRLVVTDAVSRPVAVLSLDDLLEELAHDFYDITRDPQARVAEARRDARHAALREELEEATEKLTARLQRATWLTRETLTAELGALKHRLENALLPRLRE